MKFAPRPPVRLLIALALLAASGCVSLRETPLEKAAAETFAAHEAAAPGYTLVISNSDGDDFAASVGSANLELGAPAVPETVYHIGSITKQFTAAAVMMLVEDGRVDLDNPVAEYLPEYAPYLSGATVRQLLNHTAGVRNYTSLAPPTAPLWTQTFRHDLSEAEMIDLFIREPHDFAPGEGFSYSNSGYYLAGAVVTRVSGVPYEEFLRTRIFEPLGLESAGMCRKRDIVPLRASGYRKQDGAFENNDPLSVAIPYAAGALCMNARDLARWTRALHEGKVVSAASLNAMTAPTVLKGRIEIPYGFGLFLDDVHGVRRIGHSGLFNGFTAVAWRYPESGIVSVLLSNLQSRDREDDVVFLEGEVMRRWLGIGEDAPAFEPARMADVAGRYCVGRTAHEIAVEDGALRLDGAPLTPLGPDLFLTASGPPYRVKFVRDAEGAAAFIYMRGSVSYAAEACDEERRAK